MRKGSGCFAVTPGKVGVRECRRWSFGKSDSPMTSSVQRGHR